MPDYTKYRKAVGISNGEMTHALEKRFDGYSKITAVYVNNPDKYGIQLTKEAEKYLQSKFGHAKGLSIPKPRTATPKKKQYTVKLSEAEYLKLSANCAEGESVEEYISRIIT